MEEERVGVPAILQEAGHATRPQVAELGGELDG
jgi:hypothetical protein